MKNILLSLMVGIALTAALPAKEECPSDDGFFCSQYELTQRGVASAQNNLGVMHRKGEGVARDNREAVRRFRKAAEQGHAMAQFYLGGAYHLGGGVAQDMSGKPCGFAHFTVIPAFAGTTDKTGTTNKRKIL